MKAKEIIAAVLGAMQAESARILDPHIGNTMANIEKIMTTLDALPDALNIETHVEVKTGGEEAK